ncbi:hypothetical protein F4778DRAFT_352598 [Xylariomycetidae sp. FL2044]|nr:hypothetical protein F4778DRAFT_352598 [Xylariomycetidae sp. FL2044]
MEREAARTETQGPLLWRLGIAMTILPTLAIVFRFWSRVLASPRKRFWWDDWLALCAWACCMCNCAFAMRGVQLGLGKHSEAYTSAEDLTELLKISYISRIVFDSGIAFAKFSILSFYCRVFSARSPKFQVALYTTFGLVAVFILYKLPAQIFSCVPPAKNWHPEIEGHCESNDTSFGLLLAGLLLDVITNLMILLLPLPTIYHFHMSRKEMTVVLGAFAVGYITLTTSVGRTASFISTKPHLGDPDISWYQIPELSWSLAEISVSVLSICVPSCFFLLKRFTSEGLASLFTTRDIPHCPDQDFRGRPRDNQGGRVRLSSSGGNKSASRGWLQDDLSATDTPLVPNQGVSIQREIAAEHSFCPKSMNGRVRVTRDVVLSHQESAHWGKDGAKQHEYV